MNKILLLLVVGWLGLGVSLASSTAKARGRLFSASLQDPRPAAGLLLRHLHALHTLPAWRRYVLVTLQWTVDLVTWPVSQFIVARERRRRPDWRDRTFLDPRWAGSNDELTPDYVGRDLQRRSWMTCLLAGLVTVTAATVDTPDDAVSVYVLAAAVLVATMARQGLDLLQGGALMSLARRSSRPLHRAYRDLALTVLCDLTTLSLAAEILLRWSPNVSLRPSWFGEQALATLKGTRLSRLWSDSGTSPALVLATLAAVVFYASLVTPIKAAIRRRRTGDELLAAAEDAPKKGSVAQALQLMTLGEARTPTPRNLIRVQGLVLLAQGLVLEGWDAAQAMVRLYRPQQNLEELRQREDGLAVVRMWCRELHVKPGPSVLELALRVPVRDSFIACQLLDPVDDLLPPPRESTAATLSTYLDPQGWPLAFTVAHTIDGNLTAAMEMLPSQESVAGLDLLWRNQIARGQAASPAHDRHDDASLNGLLRTHTRELCADVGAADIEAWPEWHRAAFAAQLTVLLMIGNGVLDEDLRKRLASLRHSLAGEDAQLIELDLARRAAIRSSSAVRPHHSSG